MNRMSLILASIAMVAGSAPALAGPKAALRGEEKLAKILGNRVAGAPVSCLPLRNIQGSQIVDDTAIVYESGGKLYVNRPTNADMLSYDDILVSNTNVGQLCRMDSVTLVSRAGQFQRGFVVLNQFVPYSRARPKG